MKQEPRIFAELHGFGTGINAKDGEWSSGVALTGYGISIRGNP